MELLSPSRRPDTDVPAGDIGVGGREVGFHGRHDEEAQEQRRVRLHRQGAVLWRQPDPPGSHRLRHCSTSSQDMLASHRSHVASTGCGSRCRARATSRNTRSRKAMSWAPRCHQLRFRRHRRRPGRGSRPRSWRRLMDIKNVQLRARFSDYAAMSFGLEYLHPAARPWDVPVDVALPCATQNELDEEDARSAGRSNGVKLCRRRRQHAVAPSAPMQGLVRKQRVMFAPGKASQRRWRRHLRAGDEPECRCASPGTRDEVDARLHA
jgi:glutamate dehydrogenase (NADP+)